MTDRQFNLIVRFNLRAASEHIRRGHSGRWRQCDNPLCRDAQNLVPPLEALLAHAEGASPFVRAALTSLQALERESLPN